MSSLFAKVQMYMFTGFSCMMEYYVPEDCFFSASSVDPDVIYSISSKSPLFAKVQVLQYDMD